MSFENSSFAKSLYMAGTPGRYSTRFTPSNSTSQALSETPGKTGCAITSNTSVNKSFVSSTAEEQNSSFGLNSGLAASLASVNPVASIQSKQFSATLSTPNRKNTADTSKEDTSSWSMFQGNSSFQKSQNGTYSLVKPKASIILPTPKADENTSMAIVASRMSANGTLPVTPNAALPPKPTTVPTGNWEHPCLEIIRNRTFDKKEAVKKVLFNIVAYFALHKIIELFSRQYIGAESYLGSLESYALIADHIVFVIRLVLIYNIVWNSYKLLKPADTFEDLPLTASQRKLLGLPESSKAVDSCKAITPPKYLKSTVPNRYYYADPASLKNTSSMINATPTSKSIFKKAAIAPDSPVAGLYQKLLSPFADKPQQVSSSQQNELPASNMSTLTRPFENKKTPTSFTKSSVSQVPGNTTFSALTTPQANSTLVPSASISINDAPAETSFSQNSSFEPSARYLYMAKKSSRGF